MFIANIMQNIRLYSRKHDSFNPTLLLHYYREVRVGTNINLLSTYTRNHVLVSTHEYFA